MCAVSRVPACAHPAPHTAPKEVRHVEGSDPGMILQ